MTIGMDLGDKTSRYCALDEHGDVLFERATATSQKGMLEAFGALRRCRIALEVGTHSPWVSRLLKKLGHEVIVANARQVKLITQTAQNDKLMRKAGAVGACGLLVVSPIQHRSEAAQQHLMVIRVRATLVETRTALVNSARGLAKSVGERLAKCDADNLDVERMQTLPEALQTTLKPLLEEVASVTEKIHALDERIEQIAREQYPETALLKQVSGVGNLIALTFILTVEDPARFRNSREVGYYRMRPRAAIRRGASRSWGSVKKATCICGSYLCKERTTFCAGVGRIRI
jgi:transposase